MRWLNGMIVRFSASAPLFILSGIVAFGSLFFVLLPIGGVFEALGPEAPPFDLQNELNTTQIFEQLPSYTENAKRVYFAFAYVDFFFPLFAGVFMGALAAFSLRHLAPQWYEQINRRNLFVVFMLASLFDWLENIFALTVIVAWPRELQWAAAGLVLAKQGKLTMVMVTQPVGGVLFLGAALKWLARKLGWIGS